MKKIIVISTIGMLLLTNITVLSTLGMETSLPKTSYNFNQTLPGEHKTINTLNIGKIPLAKPTLKPWLYRWDRTDYDPETNPEDFHYNYWFESAIDEENDLIYFSGCCAGNLTNGEVYCDNVLLQYNLDDLKKDPDVDPQWFANLGERVDNYYGSCVVCIYDNDVYVSYTNKQNEIELVKYNQNGEEVWSEPKICTYSGAAFSITSDQGFIYITGFTNCNGWYSDLFLFKYDTDGNKIWNVTWNNNATGDDVINVGYSVVVNNDCVYIAGYGGFRYYLDAVLLKYNTDGVLQSEKTWDVSADFDETLALSMEIYEDSLYIAGFLNPGSGPSTVFVSRYDLDFKEVWTKCWYDLTTNAPSLTVDEDSIFVSYVYIKNYGAIFLLLKYDLNGKLVFSKWWSNYASSHLGSIESYDGYLYLSGTTGYYDYKFDAIVLKCDYSGEGKSFIKDSTTTTTTTSMGIPVTKTTTVASTTQLSKGIIR